MSYVDVEYYKETFKGTSIPDDVLKQRLELASHDIDSLTYNRIVKKEFKNLTTFQQKIVQTAVCLHAEFLHSYGDFIESPLAGYSAGTTSVSFKSDNTFNQNGTVTSQRVANILKQSGLMVRAFI